jgi:hypothetical protein
LSLPRAEQRSGLALAADAGIRLPGQLSAAQRKIRFQGPDGKTGTAFAYTKAKRKAG